VKHLKQKAPTHLLCLFGRWKRNYRRWERRLLDIMEHGRPSERLWAAVLSQSIVDLYAKDSQRGSWVEAAAREWFAGAPCALGDVDAAGTLAFICRELDLPDPAVIRHDVLADREAGRQAYERQRYTEAKACRGARRRRAS
jgi:hypothetical protein